MTKIALLKEGSIRKGGHNEKPTRLRPEAPPPGQGRKMSKYLEFNVIEEKPKTKIIGIWSKRSIDKLGFNSRLGIIKWYGRWRQYAFFPENGTLFNVECLNDIQTYIKGLR